MRFDAFPLQVTDYNICTSLGIACMYLCSLFLSQMEMLHWRVFHHLWKVSRTKRLTSIILAESRASLLRGDSCNQWNMVVPKTEKHSGLNVLVWIQTFTLSGLFLPGSVSCISTHTHVCEHTKLLPLLAPRAVTVGGSPKCLSLPSSRLCSGHETMWTSASRLASGWWLHQVGATGSLTVPVWETERDVGKPKSVLLTLLQVWIACRDKMET